MRWTMMRVSGNVMSGIGESMADLMSFTIMLMKNARQHYEIYILLLIKLIRRM
jgi:hypothetical protein